MPDRQKVVKFLETARCVGIVAGVAAEVMIMIGLTTTYWVDFDYNSAHAGLFQYCHTNETLSGEDKTEDVQEWCEGLEDMPDGEIAGFLHVTRAMLIISVIICGLCTFCCGTFRCRLEGKTFRDRHHGEAFLLLASLFTFIGLRVFVDNYRSMSLLSDGTLGQSQVILQTADVILPLAVFFMVSPTLYEKYEERWGRGTPSRPVRAAPPPSRSVRRRHSEPAETSMAQGPPAYSEVVRTGEMGIMDRFRLALSNAGWGTAPPRDQSNSTTSSRTELSRRPEQVSVIVVDHHTHITTFPSVDDMLSNARARGGSSTTNSGNLSSNQNNNVDDPPPASASIDVPPPPSYDSVLGSMSREHLPPPPAYDNVAMTLDEGDSPPAPPPSYEEIVSTSTTAPVTDSNTGTSSV